MAKRKPKPRIRGGSGWGNPKRRPLGDRNGYTQRVSKSRCAGGQWYLYDISGMQIIDQGSCSQVTNLNWCARSEPFTVYLGGMQTGIATYAECYLTGITGGQNQYY